MNGSGTGSPDANGGLCMLIAAFLFFATGGSEQSPSSGAKASPTPAYTIRVSPASDVFRLGSPINVTITVKNVSDKEIYWRAEANNTAYKAFDILLTRNGREVDTTPFHRKVKGKQVPEDPRGAESGSSIVSPIEPGKSFSFTIDVTILYKITTPGEYTLTVSRVEGESDTVICSNKVTLKIK
jgi:hypothetical protein